MTRSINKYWMAAALAMTVGGCDAGTSESLRTIEIEFTGDFYGTVTTDGAVITGQLMSSATGQKVAEGTWNVDDEQRLLWMDHAEESVTHYFPRIDGVDLESYLVHELASVYQLTDGEPDNDPEVVGESASDDALDFRLNNHHPTGGFDSLYYHWPNRQVEVGGWACDLDQPSRPLTVIILAKGPRSSNEGPYQVVGYLNANQQREQAVGNACGGHRAHGFFGVSDPAIDIPYTVATHEGGTRWTKVKIHAYNVHTTGGFTYNRKIGSSKTARGQGG